MLCVPPCIGSASLLLWKVCDEPDLRSGSSFSVGKRWSRFRARVGSAGDCVSSSFIALQQGATRLKPVRGYVVRGGSSCATVQVDSVFVLLAYHHFARVLLGIR